MAQSKTDTSVHLHYAWVSQHLSPYSPPLHYAKVTFHYGVWKGEHCSASHRASEETTQISPSRADYCCKLFGNRESKGFLSGHLPLLSLHFDF